MIEDGLTLSEYSKLIKDKTCSYCEAKLHTGSIEHYPHDSGWEVKGMKEKQWLYVNCHNCGYDWSLSKLGVSR